ncbi:MULTISPECIES: MaoC family dehydratase [unclassified Nocardioides]|uniref:MaoC family dehydratase n=1 Tax=unclassified Nocardioides TaxID=2615069 RepID=UPI0036226DDA
MAEPQGRVQINGTEDALRLVGRALGPSDWVEVTQENVDSFSRSVQDWHWAHNDPERAARGLFGTTIAHAHMTLGALPHLRESLLSVTDGQLMFYGYNRVRFPSPVPVGARIRMHVVVAAVEPIELGEQLTLDIRIEIEGQERPGCVAQSVWRHYYVDTPE